MRNSPKSANGNNADPDRRRFLRNLGLSTAAAGAAVSIGNVTFAQSDDAEESEADNAETEYRETDHVRAFYATLRD